jgi:protein kinase X
MLVPCGMNNRFPQMPISKVRQVRSVCNPEAHLQFSELEIPGPLGGQFGLKTIGKVEAVKAQQQSAIANERWLWGALPQPQEEMVLPRLVATCISDNCLHMLFKPAMAMEFAETLDSMFSASKSMADKESAARFYLACSVLALEYLHGAKVLYRALAPELLMLSHVGYLQLMDYRMAKRLGGTQRSFTMIGTPDYLPPEQVRGQGHGLGADYWGLGVLLFELLAGEPPFAAGHSSELQIYAEVTSHQKGGLRFPKDCSPDVRSLLDSLLAPSEAERLGADSVGVVALQSHVWFKGIDWDELAEGNIKAPFLPPKQPPTKGGSTLKVKSVLLADYNGDASWFDGF